jgi:hypothetical protein
MKKKSLAQKAADLLHKLDKKHNLAVKDPQMHRDIVALIDSIAEEDVLERDIEKDSFFESDELDEWYPDNGY